MKKNNWYIITGPPCSGKTTLLNLLRKKGYQVVEEAARILIDREIAEGNTIERIRKNELSFQKKVLQQKINMEKQLSRGELIFFERGIPDSIAYFKLCGITSDFSLKKALNKCFYKKIFFLELLDYKKDYARVENEKDAVILERLLEESYIKLKMEVVKVPKMSIKKRLDFIIDRI